jgi:hypothetical protein
MATTTTRPDGTVSNAGWTPSGATLEASLQAVSNPTVPAATPKISVTAGTALDSVCELSLGDMPADYSVGISFNLSIWRDLTGNAGGPTGSMALISELRRSNATVLAQTTDSGATVVANVNGWVSSGVTASAANLATANGLKVHLEAIDDITKCEVKAVYVDIVYTAVGGGVNTVRLSLDLANGMRLG